MRVTAFNKTICLLKVYSNILKIKGFKQKILTLLHPLDSVRYVEIPYLLNILVKYNLNRLNVLDVSSPHQAAMLLAGNGHNVVRINPDPKEESYLIHKGRLGFKNENSLDMSFQKESFDFVYSISVIEHIYSQYLLSIIEMTKVLKKDGFLYLSFPIDREGSEVWLDHEDYPGQHHENGKYFFQYNFNPEKIISELEGLKGMEIIEKDFFWEKNEGDFDKMINQLKKQNTIKIIQLLSRCWNSLYWGINLYNQNGKVTQLGNLSIVLKKSESIN